MVYYQSTPLIVKTEQPSQAQFCTPLRATTPTTTFSSSPSSSMSPSPTVTLLQGGVSLGSYHQQLLPLHAQQQNTITPALTSQNYNLSQNNETIILQQQQQQQQQQQLQHQQQTQSTSITISSNGHQQHQHQQQQQQQNYMLTNIKQEQLPPSITLYAATPSTSTVEQPVQLTTTSTTTKSTTTSNRRGQNAGPKPQFKCEQCGMIFGSKSAHTSHVKSHAKAGEMSNVGSNGFNATANATATQLNNAIEVNEAGMPVGIPKMPQITPNAAGGSDPYQCNVCQKTFAVPARLIRHYRTHTGERPFECEFCHKLFSVKENLQVHRRIHTKERPYKCDVCGRAFEHSGKLHRHMRIHTGERPHKCSVCQKTFIQSGQLVIHMRTHTGEKPYKCPVEGCGKGFTCSKQLKVHSRTHTGEKPYHCDICFRDFGYNHVLKLHRVQHYGSKCYKCTICDKTFKSKKEMEAHIKGHANEMPDDEETNTAAGVASGQTSSISSSCGETTNSAPGSPPSPLASGSAATEAAATAPPAKTRKPRQPRIKPPPSPSSPSSTFSPTSSMASASRLSAGSPTSSVASPAPALVGGYVAAAFETDNQYNNSRDSGVATNYSAASSNARQLASHSALGSAATYANVDELPTDLSKTTTANYYQDSSPPTSTAAYSYMRQLSPMPQSTITLEPTINPALLEAATIASEEEVTKAALQIMQLQRSSTSSNLQVQSTTAYNAMAYDAQDIDQQDDDAREANELIAHYKRGDLARHGLHKRYAPVPKFESSLLNNEIIVRTVEAAIAPLRSSTESPDRSSSPESDSLMLVDRDVMTLPLRKRKLYMNGEHEENGALASEQNTNNGNSNGGEANGNQKVMRMSSVIQFAKAS